MNSPIVYALIALVVIAAIYFIFFKGKSETSRETETYQETKEESDSCQQGGCCQKEGGCVSV